MKEQIAALILGAILFTPAHAALATRPYGVASSHGIFAMASAGVFTGNGFSATASTNFGVSAATAQIVTMTGLGPQTASASYASTTNNTSSSFAHASVGIIRLSSEFENGDAIPAVTSAAYADGGWFDTITISSAGLAGTPGQLSFLLHVEGTLFAGLPNGNAGLKYVAATNTTFPELSEDVSGSAHPSTGDYADIVLENHLITIDFVYGQSFELMIRAVDRVGLRSIFGGLPPGSTSTVDFTNTLYWGGIRSVTSAGSPVSYSLITASGVDYSNSFDPNQSVPEPASLPLVAAAFALLLRFAKQRPRRGMPQLPAMARPMREGCSQPK